MLFRSCGAGGGEDEQYFCQGELYQQRGPAEYPGQPLQAVRGYADAPAYPDAGDIQVDEAVWKRLGAEEKKEIEQVCERKLELYYQRLIGSTYL